MCTYISIHIEKDRYGYMYVCIYMCVLYIYTYIYIYGSITSIYNIVYPTLGIAGTVPF